MSAADIDAGSAKHALIRGLRIRNHEAQLTQVLASVADSDPAFASAFVHLVLNVAAFDARHRRNVEAMGTPPTELTCRAEHSVYDEHDFGLGRVDLRFDGGSDFTLFVENKLHSGFGVDQLNRYQAALKTLPEERARSGLIAITRDVPSHGELDAGANGWLGAIRWARLFDEGLADLPVADPDVRVQWKLLIDVIHLQGDLGLTSVDSDLVRAWARYTDGRNHLRDVLDNIRARALDILRMELADKHKSAAASSALAGQHSWGSTESVPVHRTGTTVETGFRVPANVNRPAVKLTFWPEEGSPHFLVEVHPWKAAERLEAKETQLLDAAGTLSKAGFKDGRFYGEAVWWNSHQPHEYLDADDVPATLIGLVQHDISAIVGSGILAYDLEAAARRGRGGPPKVSRR